ncbi:hypothetical protein LZ32DRAFT_598879 [Colletotrichum eremochloae]|nr:hypothetical protein LZ32DRAFT_598879 [Colletotrichum eremochloae]
MGYRGFIVRNPYHFQEYNQYSVTIGGYYILPRRFCGQTGVAETSLYFVLCIAGSFWGLLGGSNFECLTQR